MDVFLKATDSDGTISHFTVGSPMHGSLSESGSTRTYLPDAGYFGSDSVSYTATDNAGGVSNTAMINIVVEAPMVPSVSIINPVDGADMYSDSEFTLSYAFANAQTVRVKVNGVQVATGLSGNSLQVRTPNEQGAFIVEVIAQNENAQDLDAMASIQLNSILPPVNTSPIALFTAQSSGLSVTTDASSSSDADGDALTYTWDFSGTALSGVNATHRFASAGTYAVSLTVSDGIDSDTDTQQLTVNAPAAGVMCEYKIGNEWNSGFIASIVLTNTGSEPVNSWQVSWVYPEGVERSNGWNANVSGAKPYVATPLDWNSVIQPGQSIEFGMQGKKPEGTAAPTPEVIGDLCM